MSAKSADDQRPTRERWAWQQRLPLLAALWACCGCFPADSQQEIAVPSRVVSSTEFVPADNLRGLSDELARLVIRQVRAEAGTPAAPNLVGDQSHTPERLASALALYRIHCSCCHGTTGEGTGPWADLLPVLPRDFRRGVFKFQSTPYGARPVREDLQRTVTRGIAVELLARRGEFEGRLILETEVKGAALDERETDQIAAEVDAQWREAAEQVIQPLSPQPTFNHEYVARGREKFVEKGCAKCHGEDGRGQTEQNLQGGLRDVWGHPVRAADLTTGRLKGGSAPLDIYRRILGGINGTPMPSFRAILWAEPESIWDLVAWVLHLGRINQQTSGVSTDD
jgi:mono/diheme cytochrome c family protein